MALRQFKRVVMRDSYSSMAIVRQFSAIAARCGAGKPTGPTGQYSPSVAPKTSHELPAQQRRNEESASDPPQKHPSHSPSSPSERVRKQSTSSSEGVRGPFGAPPSKAMHTSATSYSKNTGSGGYSSDAPVTSSGGKYGATTGEHGSGDSKSSGGRSSRDSNQENGDSPEESVTEKVQHAFDSVKGKVKNVFGGVGQPSASKIASQQSGGAQRIASPSNPENPPQKRTPKTSSKQESDH